jgi:hypothetical protein
MATQSPKTRKTKTTKKAAAAKVKTPAKKTVKTNSKTTNKPAVAASSAKPTRSRFSRVLRRNRSTTPKTNGAKAVSLYAWNKWLALLYIVQGLLILLLSEAHSLPVVGHYLALDSFASQGREAVRTTAQQHLFDINIVYWLAGISFIFALGHLLAASALRRRYDAQLAAGVNKHRWITYILGYGALIVLLALLVGLNDVANLALLVVLVAMSGVLGIATERAGLGSDGIVRSVAVSAFLAIWAVIAYYVINAWVYDGSIPGYEYIMLGVAFLLSLQLGRIFLTQQKAGNRAAGYINSERAYMIWTFVLIVATTWQLFVGALEP